MARKLKNPYPRASKTKPELEAVRNYKDYSDMTHNRLCSMMTKRMTRDMICWRNKGHKGLHIELTDEGLIRTKWR